MNKKVMIIVILLAVIVGAFSFLNSGDREKRVESQSDALIYLTDGGERMATIDFNDIENLESYEFDVVLRSSSNPDKDVTYKGVLVKDVLEKAGVELDKIQQVITKAVDGYAVAITAEEIEENDNVYIVYMQDGEYLKSKEDGGTGPFQIVIRKDEFGQRWNKFLMEIEIQWIQ